MHVVHEGGAQTPISIGGLTYMNKKAILVCLLLVGALFLFTACMPGNERYDVENPAGFFWGLWHGFIAIITLIGSFFNDNISIYETYNTGFFYNLGFMIGISSPLFGSHAFRN